MATLAVNNFFEVIPINSFSLHLKESLRSSTDGKGQTLTSSIGPRLWQGSISIAPTSHQKSREIIRLLSRIQDAGMTFDIYDILNQRPANWSAALQSASPVLTSLTGNRWRLDNMPNGYRVVAGDLFSVPLNGANRLLRIDTDGQVSGAGRVVVDVAGPINTGGLPVTFDRAKLTCQLVPNSMKISPMGLDSWQGASFDFIQSFVA